MSSPIPFTSFTSTPRTNKATASLVSLAGSASGSCGGDLCLAPEYPPSLLPPSGHVAVQMTDLIRSVGELIAMSDVNGCMRRVTTGQNGKMDAADFAGFWLRYQRIGTRFV
jgi:hypothetical protein